MRGYCWIALSIYFIFLILFSTGQGAADQCHAVLGQCEQEARMECGKVCEKGGMVQQSGRLRDCRDVREECTKDAYKQCTDQFDACARAATTSQLSVPQSPFTLNLTPPPGGDIDLHEWMQQMVAGLPDSMKPLMKNYFAELEACKGREAEEFSNCVDRARQRFEAQIPALIASLNEQDPTPPSLPATPLQQGGSAPREKSTDTGFNPFRDLSVSKTTRTQGQSVLTPHELSHMEDIAARWKEKADTATPNLATAKEGRERLTTGSLIADEALKQTGREIAIKALNKEFGLLAINPDVKAISSVLPYVIPLKKAGDWASYISDRGAGKKEPDDVVIAAKGMKDFNSLANPYPWSKMLSRISLATIGKAFEPLSRLFDMDFAAGILDSVGADGKRLQERANAALDAYQPNAARR